jgi:hypothetical protein
LEELLRTNDAVLLSWLEALLKDFGIHSQVLDSHTSILEGSVGVLPRRLMVLTEDAERARRILDDAKISYA